VNVGDYVVLETSRGVEVGRVALPPHEVEESDLTEALKPVVRRATAADLLLQQHYRGQESAAYERCKQEIERHQLPMKLVGAEYNYDGSRLTFFFTSESRVDFRELVKELASIFKTRIELRQVGARDEAKYYGGLGRCGRPLCCAAFLGEFASVSIRMAKDQDLPLNPMKISGCCGRLLCCLGYENELYCELKRGLPRVGETVTTHLGEGTVEAVNVLKGTVVVELASSRTRVDVLVEQLVPPHGGDGKWEATAGASTRRVETMQPGAPGTAAQTDSDRKAIRARDRDLDKGRDKDKGRR